ncbi:hypothetical protein NX059_005313 [Plenodomus lindquistii]|nr:hypothetical protein NX059_005313 [Plenodomus lindquistii]
MSMHHDTQVSDQPKEQNHENTSTSRTGPETGAPIAKVLNNVEAVPYVPYQPHAAHNFSTTPFSGRLVDLLLDTPASPPIRDKSEYMSMETRPIESNHSVIQLPKLPQLAAKKTQRPRIPPLLQGLHQPPPLPPSNRLFPPITSDKSAFNNGSRDRGSFDSRGGINLNPVKSSNAINAGTVITRSEDAHETNSLKQSRTISNDLEANGTDGSEHTTSSKGKTQVNVPPKSSRRRKRWTEQETKDLLVGVQRYGIGSWKKILQCPDFTFNERTAVDLKDRFRVCCPSETSKPSKPRTKSAVAEPQSGVPPPDPSRPSVAGTHDHHSVEADAPSLPEPTKWKKPSDSTIVASQMEDIGISGPFTRRARRPQRKFSKQDDINLLKGFEKYGSVWRAICDDAELDFSGRKPTDLRDRFRIKYPDEFKKAGHKLKAKHDKIVVDQQAASRERTLPRQRHVPEATATTPPQSAKRNSWYTAEAERLTRPNDSIPDLTLISPTNPTSRSNDNTPYTFNPFPTMFDDYGSLEHDDFSNSPIILNRDILQWADANHNSAYNQVASNGLNDTASRVNSTMEGNHFNTWAGGFQNQSTTDLPLTNAIPPAATTTTSRPSLSSDIPSHTRSASLNLATTHVSTNASPSNLTTGPSAKNSLLETPNLPTIVFPHVPAASARNTLHNLPTPADLLSGVEDDALGFVNEFSRTQS